MINREFWNNKKILITGNTGFKGSWLSIWLNALGANVYGYSLKPPTEPSLYKLAQLEKDINQCLADIRDLDKLKEFIDKIKPDIVFHMAAQPLVRESYKYPVETYQINVMGTVSILEAIRLNGGVRAFVNVTTDKCYDNKEWHWGYREYEPMGGYDPYSNSKGCSELVTSAYRSSYFNPIDYGKKHNTAIASARAGNVIGGGDFATDRLIPDFVRSIIEKKPIIIRNPKAIRPWQHVLEPLSGYLTLAEALYNGNGKYSEAWNFGPNDEDAKPVEWIVKKLCKDWKGAEYKIDCGENPHEANYLKLDCSKAKAELNWYPRWNLNTALDKITEWTNMYIQKGNIKEVTLKQIEEYMKSK